jgi:flagellar motor protein MotB
MMLDGDASVEDATPVWAVFGDLMSGLLGAFVLLLVGVLVIHLEVATHLEAEVKLRQQEEQRRLTLEKALAIPLASGRITLDNGRIGISGRFLFAVNSDQLQPEGKILLESLIKPLQTFLTSRGEILMISGFTDDRSIRGGNNQFTDNWELSAQRALTVTRALIDEGMPSGLVFAAAFGSEQPIAPNADEKGRTLNRRVEMSPVPRTTHSKPVTHE